MMTLLRVGLYPVRCLSQSLGDVSQSLPASLQGSCSFWEPRGDWQLPPDGARDVLAPSMAPSVPGAWCCMGHPYPAAALRGPFPCWRAGVWDMGEAGVTGLLSPLWRRICLLLK